MCKSIRDYMGLDTRTGLHNELLGKEYGICSFRIMWAFPNKGSPFYTPKYYRPSYADQPRGDANCWERSYGLMISRPDAGLPAVNSNHLTWLLLKLDTLEEPQQKNERERGGKKEKERDREMYTYV